MASYGEIDSNGVNKISNLRHPYRDSKDTFLEHHLVSTDPMKQFALWMEEAVANKNVVEANAMSLSTVSSDGKPSARMVLLKGYDEDGFHFYTNHESRKAKEIELNPNVALVFYWNIMHRSVRIEGVVKRMEGSKSAEYFSTRPRSSQIAAHVSTKQSSPVESREKLIEIENNLEAKFQGCDIPKPEFWGGYVVKPECIEFWQGQSNRMHDRLRFRRRTPEEKMNDNMYVRQGENGWIYERLMP